MQKKNTTKKAASIQQIRDEQDAENNAKVQQAIWELLHNGQTPGDLFEKVAEFVCERINKGQDGFYHSDKVLALLLESIPENELRHAIITERMKEVRHAAK
jgi:O-succinylbenzoate synthase